MVSTSDFDSDNSCSNQFAPAKIKEGKIMIQRLSTEEKLNADKIIQKLCDEINDKRLILSNFRKDFKYCKGYEFYNEKIFLFKRDIKSIRNKIKKVASFIYTRDKNKDTSMYFTRSDMYKLFGKQKWELNKDEIREYNRIKKQESRKKAKDKLKKDVHF